MKYESFYSKSVAQEVATREAREIQNEKLLLAHNNGRTVKEIIDNLPLNVPYQITEENSQLKEKITRSVIPIKTTSSNRLQILDGEKLRLISQVRFCLSANLIILSPENPDIYLPNQELIDEYTQTAKSINLNQDISIRPTPEW
jgi:hypothetical protein